MSAVAQSIRSDFYVYVLFRDTGVPFYVGKGKGRRWAEHATEASRGRIGHRFNIIRDMQARGVEMPKVKLHDGLTEEVAHEYEIALIAAIGRRPLGPLVNRTDGGDGSSGCFPSSETRARLSASRAGKKQPPEQIAARAALHRGRKRSLETRAKQSERAKARSPESRAYMAILNASRSPEVIAKSVAAMRAGQTPESIEKTAAKNRGKPRSAETRAKIAMSNLGKKQSPEHIANRVAARLAADARRRAAAQRITNFCGGVPGPRQSLLDFGPR